LLDGSYFIECDCGSDEHTLRFTIDADEQTIYLSTFLCQYRSIFQRIWVAVKYVFGYKCKYGHWDVTSMSKEQVSQLKQIILKYDELTKK
jgi:hypothetical protein